MCVCVCVCVCVYVCVCVCVCVHIYIYNGHLSDEDSPGDACDQFDARPRPATPSSSFPPPSVMPVQSLCYLFLRQSVMSD